MKYNQRLMSFFILWFLVMLAVPAASICSNIRKPVWAGKFYPSENQSLESAIRKLTRQAKKSTPVIPAEQSALRALILPHAGYIYSGLTAAHASHVLHKNQFRKVMLLGTDHRVGFRNCAISTATEWETPLKTTLLHPDTVLLSEKKPALFKSVPESESSEHSLEVILPFLQFYLDEFSLVPITVGNCNPKHIASQISALTGIDKDAGALLVASTDLSHYLPYNDAVKKDKETIGMIMNLDSEALQSHKDSACGVMPVLILIEIAKSSGWKPSLLHYSNSGDTQGDKSRVVGYTTIAFYGGKPMKPETTSTEFSDDQGTVLLQLARKTISEKLGKTESGVTVPEDDIFRSRRGTFVTLKINNQLRGCIGNLSTETTVVEGIRRNAINAAFNDYRFTPLKPEELDTLEIEVSILSEPLPLEHSGGKDLVSKLQPGVDGVIIRLGRSSATFLPQVWDQLPEPDEFLSHLCRKAGLTADAWKSESLEVSTYQVQYFEEHD